MKNTFGYGVPTESPARSVGGGNPRWTHRERQRDRERETEREGGCIREVVGREREKKKNDRCSE